MIDLKTKIADDSVLVRKSWFTKVATDKSAIDFNGDVTFFDMKKINGVRQLMDMTLNPKSHFVETDNARIEELINKIDTFMTETASYPKPVYRVEEGGWIYYVNEYMAEIGAMFVQEFKDGSVQYGKTMMVSKTPINKTASIFTGIQVVPPRPEQ